MKSFPVLAILVLAFSALSSAVADDYTDELVGFSFVKLAGWTLNPRAPLNAGPGTCVGMQDTDAPEYEFITICGKPDITESAGINQALRSGFSNYIAWRAATLAAGTQLTVRPSSLVAGTIGGQESLAVIVDYAKDNNAVSAAYIVWVESGKTRLSLIGETAPSNLDNMMKRLQPIRDSIRIP